MKPLIRFNQKRTAGVVPFLIDPRKDYSRHYLPEESALTDVFGYMVDLMAELGRGGFGTVYKGTNRFGDTIAVKKISKKEKAKASAEAVKFHYFKRKISHTQIIEVYDVKSGDDSMWIMMEYCDLGDLNEYFKRNNWLRNDIHEKVILMQQIINGIAFLHNNDIAHRDIKPGNVLLKSKPLGTPPGQTRGLWFVQNTGPRFSHISHEQQCRNSSVSRLQNFGIKTLLTKSDITEMLMFTPLD